MNGEPRRVKASEVRVGDRIRSRELDLTVTRIDTAFFGRDDMIAFVEDSELQWLKVPSPVDADIEVVG